MVYGFIAGSLFWISVILIPNILAGIIIGLLYCIDFMLLADIITSTNYKKEINK